MIIKRKRLSLAEKNHLLDEVETGQVKKVAIARKWGIADRTLRVIVNQKDKWRKAYVEGRSENIYSTRTTPFPRLDSELMAWLGIAMQLGLPISHKVLSNKALCIKDDMLRSPGISDFERDILARFTASKGWVIRFCKRNHLESLKFSRVHDEGDCNSLPGRRIEPAQANSICSSTSAQGCMAGNGICYKLFSGMEYEGLQEAPENGNMGMLPQNHEDVLDSRRRINTSMDEGRDLGPVRFPHFDDLVGPLGELEAKLLPVGDAEVNHLLQKLRQTICEKQGGSFKIG